MATFTIGDSITHGHCDGEMHAGYVGRLKARLDRMGDESGMRAYDVINLASSGKDTDFVLQTLEGALDGRRRRYAGRILVLAMIGGLESMYKIEPQTDELSGLQTKVERPVTDINTFGKTVVELANMCVSHRAYLAFIGNSFIARTEPYERRPGELFSISDSRYAAYQAPVRAVATAIGAPYIELHDAMAEAAKTQQIISDDGVHPASPGHELIEKLVWDSGVVQDFYDARLPLKNTPLPEGFSLTRFDLVA